MRREQIRVRLQNRAIAGQLQGDFAVAGMAPDNDPLVPAAVLVPLVDRPAGMTVLLTQRSEHLPKHPGQVAFPGGRIDHGDADAVAAALREAEEEIGLAANQVDVAGVLDDYQTGTGFLVTPVVGFLPAEPNLQANPAEVAAIFEVPLSLILDTRNHQRHSRLFKGKPRQYYVLPYEGYYIWGATAAMLVNLALRLVD